MISWLSLQNYSMTSVLFDLQGPGLANPAILIYCRARGDSLGTRSQFFPYKLSGMYCPWTLEVNKVIITGSSREDTVLETEYGEALHSV